jgi:hypothetical protein
VVNSNITFGTDGKDKDGKSIPGWGYYEIFWHLAVTDFALSDHAS